MSDPLELLRAVADCVVDDYRDEHYVVLIPRETWKNVTTWHRTTDSGDRTTDSGDVPR
jgi:hypothetical protein